MEQFEFGFEPKYRVPLLLIGVHPGNSWVRLTDDGHLRVRFGLWRLETPLSNVACHQVTQDYRWFKAIGARGSFVDRGVTFGTNAARGVCTRFHEPVPSLVIGDMMKHPGMTVTLADCDAFVEALERRGIGPDPTGAAS